MDLRALGGGWVECELDEQLVHVRFHLADDGRLVPFEAYTVIKPPAKALTQAAMRDLPLNAVEAAANGPALREELIERLDESFRLRWSGDHDPDTGRRRRRKPTGKLPEVEGRKRPDDWYRRAADEYARLVAAGDRAPAQTIAKANGVPPTTAHRWIKEARRRGFLPAGRPGRAG